MAADSHRTISKNSSGCRLLIGHKKCFVLLCPIGERLGCYQQEQFNLPREHFVFDPSHCILNNRKVKMREFPFPCDDFVVVSPRGIF